MAAPAPVTARFSINIDGTGYVRLHDFSGTNNAGFNADGAFPQSGLVLSGNELYGTAMAGGSSGNGTVFMLDTNGQNFITLHSFTATNAITGTNADGQAPIGGLVMSGNALYGTTSAGGAVGYGFRLRHCVSAIFDHCPFGNECDPKLANRRHRLQFAIRHQPGSTGELGHRQRPEYRDQSDFRPSEILSLGAALKPAFNRITFRITDVPGPRGFHDVFQLRILRTPAQFVERLVRRRHELGRVARTARLLNRRNLFSQ